MCVGTHFSVATTLLLRLEWLTSLYSTLAAVIHQKLSRDHISFNSSHGTQTIVVSKGQALIDGVLRRLPAAHLIPLEAKAQEVIVKKKSDGDLGKCGAKLMTRKQTRASLPHSK
jgi:hypothetical protein